MWQWGAFGTERRAGESAPLVDGAGREGDLLDVAEAPHVRAIVHVEEHRHVVVVTIEVELGVERLAVATSPPPRSERLKRRATS